MASSLLLNIARGVWFIEPKAAEAYRPVVEALLSGKSEGINLLMPKTELDEVSNEERMQKRFCGYLSGSDSNSINEYSSIESAPDNSIAMVRLTSVVMKNDFCGSPGTATLSKWMQRDDANPKIAGHIIFVDSPGGSPDGTLNFAETIKSLSKPVVVYVDGMAASAAYWIASAGKYIMASNPLCEIGSIGTYITLTDYREYYKKNGINEVVIYATKSTEKNIEYRKAIDGDTKPIIENMLDPFNEQFLMAVKRNRFSRNLNQDKTLNGQLYLTDNAIKYGLIDGTGTLKDAMDMVYKLSKNNA